ncbi:MAG TPA: NlpC/P60 family protein [bacterium]|nr:NlpC/P60 family protein [bacterium]
MWRGVVGVVGFLVVMVWPGGAAHAGQIYTVRQGDTLWRISHRFSVRPLDLATANHLALTSIIHPGLRLTIPGAFTPDRSVSDADPETPRAHAASPQARARQADVLPPAPESTRSPAPAPALGEPGDIARMAYQYLGRPYQWSGMGNYGFDCSGLVARVFAALGRLVPHTSFGQYQAGRLIPREKLTPGDLVFFHTYRAGASHVGIYLGEDRFIHASYSRGVIISSIEEPYFRARYLGARRL